MIKVNSKYVNYIEQMNLNDQTIQFWNLQFQFLELNSWDLFSMYISIRNNTVYRPTKLTQKLDRLSVDWRDKPIKEKERQCLATHLALQLAGVEE